MMGKLVERTNKIIAANSIGGSEVDDQYASLSRLIATRVLGVKPDDQDLELDDHDWRLIIDALSHKALILAESGIRSPQFWLAELDQYDNPKLCDGSHDDRAGVEKAAYLLGRLGLAGKRRFACAEVILTQVTPEPHGANEDAIKALNSIGLKP